MKHSHQSSVEKAVEKEYRKRWFIATQTSAYFLILFFVIQAGRQYIDNPVFFWGVLTTFLMLTMRVFMHNRYALLANFAPGIILIATAFISVILFNLVSEIPGVDDFLISDSPWAIILPVAYFLTCIAVGTGAAVYLFQTDRLQKWADMKLRRSIEQRLEKRS